VDVQRIEVYANGQLWRTFAPTNPEGIVKFDRVGRLSLARDTWFVVVVRGERSLAPVVPDYRDRKTGEPMPVVPVALTNPIWVDADGDGGFMPPNPRRSFPH
jgi:hypothetical protein